MDMNVNVNAEPWGIYQLSEVGRSRLTFRRVGVKLLDRDR